jgi:hypothetical protein
VSVDVAVGGQGTLPGVRFEELGAEYGRGLDDPVPLLRAVPV